MINIVDSCWWRTE